MLLLIYLNVEHWVLLCYSSDLSHDNFLGQRASGLLLIGIRILDLNSKSLTRGNIRNGLSVMQKLFVLLVIVLSDQPVNYAPLILYNRGLRSPFFMPVRVSVSVYIESNGSILKDRLLVKQILNIYLPRDTHILIIEDAFCIQVNASLRCR